MTGTAPTVDLFTDRHRWGDMVAWRRDALALHDHGPIHRIERAGFDPFWAVIGHADVLDVERRPAVFTNAPQPVLASRKTIAAQPFALRTLVHLDAPDHPKYRKLTADWFRPASLTRLTARLDELSERAVRRLEAAGGTCDFAVDIALPFPLEVILEILGLPKEDFPLMLRLTQEWLGNDDPDLRRASSTSEDFGQALRDIMKYFTVLTAERQANPTDDLASLIANGIIDGEPLSTMDRLSGTGWRASPLENHHRRRHHTPPYPLSTHALPRHRGNPLRNQRHHRAGDRRGVHPVMDLSGAAIVGIGRTAYTRSSGRMGLALAAEAIRGALDDAGLVASDVDGMTCFSTGDPASPLRVAHAIGLDEIGWSVNTLAGGNQVALVVANAAAAIITGQADVVVVVVYRVLDANVRYGKVTGEVTVGGPEQFAAPHGYMVPPQRFAMWAQRHQHVYGSTIEDLGAIAINGRNHAVNNPHAIARDPITLDQYLAGRWVVEPFRVFDCAYEVDGAVALALFTYTVMATFEDFGFCEKVRSATTSVQAGPPTAAMSW